MAVIRHRQPLTRQCSAASIKSPAKFNIQHIVKADFRIYHLKDPATDIEPGNHPGHLQVFVFMKINHTDYHSRLNLLHFPVQFFRHVLCQNDFGHHYPLFFRQCFRQSLKGCKRKELFCPVLNRHLCPWSTCHLSSLRLCVLRLHALCRALCFCSRHPYKSRFYGLQSAGSVPAWWMPPADLSL